MAPEHSNFKIGTTFSNQICFFITIVSLGTIWFECVSKVRVMNLKDALHSINYRMRRKVRLNDYQLSQISNFHRYVVCKCSCFPNRICSKASPDCYFSTFCIPGRMFQWCCFTALKCVILSEPIQSFWPLWIISSQFLSLLRINDIHTNISTSRRLNLSDGGIHLSC